MRKWLCISQCKHLVSTLMWYQIQNNTTSELVVTLLVMWTLPCGFSNVLLFFYHLGTMTRFIKFWEKQVFLRRVFLSDMGVRITVDPNPSRRQDDRPDVQITFVCLNSGHGSLPCQTLAWKRNTIVCDTSRSRARVLWTGVTAWRVGDRGPTTLWLPAILGKLTISFSEQQN